MVFNKISLFSLLFFLLLSPAYGDVVDRAVAVVNDEVITMSEVNEEGKALLQRVAENVPAEQLPEALKQVREDIINKLIEKKILIQEAEKAQISVSDEEVDMAFSRILETNNLTPEQFRGKLSELGLTEKQYKENLRTQVLSSKLVNLEIRSKVIIPEDMVIDYYDTHYTERISEGGYYILQIGIGWDEGAAENAEIPSNREEALVKAERIRSLAMQGRDFRELARAYSTLPSAVDGGDLGVLKENDMPEEMLEIISTTKTGEITPIIETPAGYQFFKILSSQEGQIVTKVPYESVKDDIYETLYQQEMEGRYEKWLEETKKKAFIKIL